MRHAAAPLLAACLGSLALVGLCILFVDRAWADYAHSTLRQNPFIWLTWIAEPVLPAAVAGLIGMGGLALTGWRPGYVARALLACCIGVAIAYILKEQLKFAFGRTWPETWTQNNPSWIESRVFAFQFFHGGRGWTSFPSGHMAMIAVPMTVLARLWPRLRLFAVLATGLVAVGLLGANYHWPSDVIAGAFVGWASATAALWLARPSR